jgi:hypothetical protein
VTIPWTDRDNQILRKLHKAGKTDNAIAEHMGRCFKSVQRKRLDMGLKPHKKPPGGKKLTAEQTLAAREMYRNGARVADIALKFKIRRDAIRAAIKDINENRKAAADVLRSDVIRLRKSHLTVDEIAAKLSVSRNVVMGILWRAGLSHAGLGRRGMTGKRKGRIHGNVVIHSIPRDPYRGEAPTGCRYPHGEGADLKWCNAERRQGSPYCPDHHALCHKPVMMEAAE